MTTTSPRRWPLTLIAAPAAVAVWSGWVGLGTLCGFGVIHPLPGIWDGLRLNTAITLPVGVEAYGAYALGAWLAPSAPREARTFARRSAIGALCLGMAGQIIYHLLDAAHATRAPWPVVVLVSCMPVVTLGFGAALTHLLRPARTRTETARTDAAGTEPERTAPGEPPRPADVSTRMAVPAGTGTAPPMESSRTGRTAVTGDDQTQPALPPAGVDRAALVAELAAQMRAAQAAGTEWRPDYPALMERTGYRRSWCEKAVRAAREAARTADAPAPALAGRGGVSTDSAQPAPAGAATGGEPRTGSLPLPDGEAA
jgi:hypothetical protein